MDGVGFGGGVDAGGADALRDVCSQRWIVRCRSTASWARTVRGYPEYRPQATRERVVQEMEMTMGS